MYFTPPKKVNKKCDTHPLVVEAKHHHRRACIILYSLCARYSNALIPPICVINRYFFFGSCSVPSKLLIFILLMLIIIRTPRGSRRQILFSLIETIVVYNILFTYYCVIYSSRSVALPFNATFLTKHVCSLVFLFSSSLSLSLSQSE